MPLPKLDFTGQRISITMMELRSSPGEIIDRVSRGLVIDVEKNGKRVAILSNSDTSSDTIINRDGSISGQIPLTFRRYLGNGGYGS